MAAEPARALSPPRRLHFRNPFVLRVGQVMTGFGIGCGLGIGIGRPINLGTVRLVDGLEFVEAAWLVC